MFLVLLLAAAALLGDTHSANVKRHMKLLSEIDNHIEPNAVPSKPGEHRRYINMNARPNATYEHAPGATLALTCDASAGPAPSVHWFKNDAPVYEHDIESNEYIDNSPSSIGRITSTLLVARTAAVDVYTCLVRAGGLTARSSTVLYSTGTDSAASERERLSPLEPRIVVSYKVYVDVMGAVAALPCRARGHPRPRLAWRDNRGQLVHNHPRMQVLRSGELVIAGLRWADMGQFTCEARSSRGLARAHTFVYPARAV